jgi:hypothetical protein
MKTKSYNKMLTLFLEFKSSALRQHFLCILSTGFLLYDAKRERILAERMTYSATLRGAKYGYAI